MESVQRVVNRLFELVRLTPKREPVLFWASWLHHMKQDGREAKIGYIMPLHVPPVVIEQAGELVVACASRGTFPWKRCFRRLG